MLPQFENDALASSSVEAATAHAPGAEAGDPLAASNFRGLLEFREARKVTSTQYSRFRFRPQLPQRYQHCEHL